MMMRRRSSLGASIGSNLEAPIRRSLGALQQLSLAPIGATIKNNLEGSSYGSYRGAPRLLLIEVARSDLLGEFLANSEGDS